MRRVNPALLGVTTVTVAAAVGTTLHQTGGSTPEVARTLTSDRFIESGTYLAAVAAAFIGAQARSQGIALGWWASGLDRGSIVARVLRRAVPAAALVVVAWWSAALLTLTTVAGAPRLGSSIASLATTLSRDGLLVLLLGGLGAAIGFLVGRAGIAAAWVTIASLPFSSDALGLVPHDHLWLYALSPIASARVVFATGTGDALTGLHIDHGAAVAMAVATLAWSGALLVAMAHVPLLAGTRRRRRSTGALAVAGSLAGVAIVGAVLPARMAAGVRWQLRPEWRHAVAAGRSSRQRSAAWLRCRQRHIGVDACRRFEVPGGAQVPAATRRVLRTSRHPDVEPAIFLVEPSAVAARVQVPERRSGHAVIAQAQVDLVLHRDGRGGWLVAAVGRAEAVLR